MNKPSLLVSAKQPEMIRLCTYDFDGIANAGGGNINFRSRHIANYDGPDDARSEYLGVLIHEVTHPGSDVNVLWDQYHDAIDRAGAGDRRGEFARARSQSAWSARVHAPPSKCDCAPRPVDAAPS